ncbi:MAG: lipid A export permease/ATP-binding protein MsbA [Nitrospira sp. SB0662_bin_26]|nr:lipid A export permease/ATP-binding protein MsbA [Nitrospira sp. SB0662_bin_26]
MSGMTVYFRILSYLHEYRFRLIVACLCAAGVAGMSGLYAWLVQPVLDEIFIAKDQLLLTVLPLVILGAAALKGLFAYGQAYLMSYVGNRVVAEVRQQLFGHFLRMSLPFHQKHSSGRLVARVINDVNEMANAVPNVIRDLIQQGLTLLVLTGVAFYQNWKLATALLVVMPVSTYAIVKIGKRLRKLAARGQESMGDMASSLKEGFAGIRIVKAYGGEHVEQQRFAKGNTAYLRAVMKSAQLAALTSPLLEVIGIGGIAFIVWYGGFSVIDGQMKPGEFFSFLAAMFMAYAPLKKLASANVFIQRAIAAANRVFEMLDTEHEFVHDRGRATLPAISRSLEFQNVSFRYEGSDDPAIAHIDLTVEFGEVIALVGKSGSGKSTLMSLVPRFYDPSEGRILIDGLDLKEVTLASLRAQIAIVSQDTVLFDESVRANIAYGRPNASEEEIIQAARAGYAWEFIEELPNGLDTLIGENGVTLSGGQRQRLAIARAILRNPPLLILDEATSALDTESERKVQAALAELMKNRTTLVIAHRLSTVQHADRIVVLDEGRVVEAGIHHELLRRNGVYTRLHQTQFHDVPAASTLP